MTSFSVHRDAGPRPERGAGQLKRDDRVDVYLCEEVHRRKTRGSDDFLEACLGLLWSSRTADLLGLITRYDWHSRRMCSCAVQDSSALPPLNSLCTAQDKASTREITSAQFLSARRSHVSNKEFVRSLYPVTLVPGAKADFVFCLPLLTRLGTTQSYATRPLRVL